MSRTIVSTSTGKSSTEAVKPSRQFNKLVFDRLKYFTLNVLALAVGIGVWQIAAVRLNSPYVPAPSAVWEAFVGLFEHGDTLGYSLSTHIWSSVYRLLVGFVIGTVVAVPMGLLFGLYYPLYRSTRAVIEPFRFIPPIAWIPLAIILLQGIERYAFLIFLGAFFPTFTATMVSVGRVEAIHKKVFQLYGATRLGIIRHVVIPTVLPDIMGGMRVGLGTAWMTIVAAELTGGDATGLGRMMINYSELLQIPQVVVGMVLIGVIGFAFNEIILLTEKRLFRWRAEVTL